MFIILILIFVYESISCFTVLSIIISVIVKRQVCSSTICQNGGTCMDDGGILRCSCVDDYKGKFCEGLNEYIPYLNGTSYPQQINLLLAT